MRPQSAQEQADEDLLEGRQSQLRLPSASPAPASGHATMSPEQSETGVVDRVMKAHGLTRDEAESEIEAFGG